MGKESFQGFDENGRPTSELSRKQIQDGALHGAAHVWIYRKAANGPEVMLQVRADNKMTWPGYADISAAGHMDAGEEPIDAAIRETVEEISLQLKAESLRLLFVVRAHLLFRGERDIIENEFRWVYAHELSSETSLEFVDGEVSAIKWISLEDFTKLVLLPSDESRLVPQGDDYFSMLLVGLQRLVGEDN